MKNETTWTDGDGDTLTVWGERDGTSDLFYVRGYSEFTTETTAVALNYGQAGELRDQINIWLYDHTPTEAPREPTIEQLKEQLAELYEQQVVLQKAIAKQHIINTVMEVVNG